MTGLATAGSARPSVPVLSMFDPVHVGIDELGRPVIHLIHNATDEDGDMLEVSESVWPSDRVIVIDDYDITQEAEDQAGMSDV